MLLKTKIIKLLASMTNLQSNFAEHVLTAIRINNIDAHALVDTGSTYSYTGCGQSPWTTLKCDISVNSE